MPGLDILEAKGLSAILGGGAIAACKVHFTPAEFFRGLVRVTNKSLITCAFLFCFLNVSVISNLLCRS